LTLIGTVVIHDPDFFVAGAITDEKYFTFGDALNTTAQSENNFVGEFVGDEARVIVGGEIGVLLA